MSDQIAVRFSPAGGPTNVTEELKQRLSEIFKQGEVYHLEPKPKDGETVFAAFDWVLISRIADLAGIASALWLIYAELIRPQLKKMTFEERRLYDSPVLYIEVDHKKGLMWKLGEDYQDREIFIKDFVTKVTQYQETDESGRTFIKTETEIQADEFWVRKK